MRVLRAWLVRIASALGIRRRDRDFDEEIDSHLQLHIDDNLRAGMSPAEARRQALMKFGAIEAVREQHRDRRGVPALQLLTQAGRQASRSIRRHPAFSAALVAILALGVGASVAVFGLVDALLFRPPSAVQAPERLFHLEDAENYVQYQYAAARTRTLELAAYVRPLQLSLGQGIDADDIPVVCVTASYFPVLGTRPTIGRPFGEDDDAPGATPTALLGHGLWRRRFGADPDVIGRTIQLAGRRHLIIGVAPADFRGLGLGRVDAWIPLAAAPDSCSFTGRSLLTSSGGAWLTTVGRLKDGIPLADAEAEIASMKLEHFRRPDSGISPRQLEPVFETRRDSVRRDARLALWLAGAAALVLLIGCANVAGLLAVRAIERRREVAIRMQLGASRLRVFLQLAAETVILATACGVVAAVVAAWIGQMLAVFFSARVELPSLDLRMLAALAGFAALAGMLAGLVPAVKAARARPDAAWRSIAAVSEDRGRLRSALLAGQVGLALLLAIGAGLFAQSVRAARSGLGYDLDVVSATMDLDRAGIRGEADKQAVFDRLADRVRQAPGIEAVALTTKSPLASTSVMVLPGAGSGLSRVIQHVTPDYFRTMGTRILRGRPFDARDGAGAPPVAILDQGLAREMWPDEDVLGRCKAIYSQPPCFVIVGISESRRMSSLTEPDGEIFFPLSRGTPQAPQALLARGSRSPDAALAAISAAVRETAALPFVSVRRLDELADVRARSWRLGAAMFGLFGVIAVVLAATGIYAALAFAVRQRTAEIGVRLTLGAAPGDILRLVLGQGAAIVVLGWALGTAAAALGTGALEGLLFGVSPTDTATFVSASLVIALAGLAGCLLPAIRAARVDPVVALRCE